MELIKQNVKHMIYLINRVRIHHRVERVDFFQKGVKKNVKIRENANCGADTPENQVQLAHCI